MHRARRLSVPVLGACTVGVQVLCDDERRRRDDEEARMREQRAWRGGGARRPVTAFVLSGGGNQGVAQVGMLRALLERGIVPDVVVTSAAGVFGGAGVS